MSKRIYLKNPIRLLFAFVVVVSLTAMFILLFQGTASGDSMPEYRTVLVAQGDSLWNIAKENRNEDMDIRDQISEIKELNGIKAGIKVGQELIVRIK